MKKNFCNKKYAAGAAYKNTISWVRIILYTYCLSKQKRIYNGVVFLSKDTNFAFMYSTTKLTNSINMIRNNYTTTKWQKLQPFLYENFSTNSDIKRPYKKNNKNYWQNILFELK